MTATMTEDDPLFFYMPNTTHGELCCLQRAA
jgi:hypothetical protein